MTPRELAGASEEAQEDSSLSPRVTPSAAVPFSSPLGAISSPAPDASPSPSAAAASPSSQPSFPTQPPSLPPVPTSSPERPLPTNRSQSTAADNDGTVRVRVVARVRPLLQLETAGQTRSLCCVEVAGQKVTAGRHAFSFDQVFGPDAAQEEIYADCVEPLVDAAFDGVNAAFLAYGQTGSGKTYTMGTSGLASAPPGALQRAIRSMFQRARALDEQDASTEVRVTFIEILTIGTGSSYGGKAGEEVRDLLSLGRSAPAMVRECGFGGNIRLEGVEEHVVTEEAQALRLVALGSAARATACTRTNDSSSRSHAIFTMELTQRRLSSGVPSTLRAKFHFVDLAGSEKVKVSGVEGQQLNQAININYGLFVLGKVITALSEGHSHVPLRESTLTRFLQHSLGGNSRTCMVACVSPAEINLAESISTLTYGAKAKKIRNTPVVNKDTSCPNCAAMQARLCQLTSPCHPLLKPNGTKPDMAASDGGLPRSGHGGGGGSSGIPRHLMEQMRQENKRLERELRELRARRESCDSRVLEAIAACSEELQDLKEGGVACREGTPRFGKSFGVLRWSAESLLGPRQGSCPSFASDSPGPQTSAPGLLPSAAGGEAAEEAELRRQLQNAEASASRSNELFHRLSERFASLQRAVQEKQIEVDDALLLDLPSSSCVAGGEASASGCGASATASAMASLLNIPDTGLGSPGAGDFEEDMELSSLEREAGRKRDLLACMEENRHATAVLEAISEEKLKQQEVARDLAERELQRLEAELETARTERQQEVRSLQERCDQKAAALKEKNAALQREREEIRRLRGMQSRLSTRLKVLSDSIRQVTEQRDHLKERLSEERRLRKKEEASARKERQAAQGKIKNLISRVAALESTPTPPQPPPGRGGSSTSTTASVPHGASASALPGLMRSPPRLNGVGRAASAACIGTPPDMSPRCSASDSQPPGLQQQPTGSKSSSGSYEQGPWARLLHSTGERARRKQVAMQVQEDFDELHAKVLAVTAERERLAVSAEVSDNESHAALDSLEMELEGLTGALKYQREKVWMAAREVEVMPNQDMAEAAKKLAEGMSREELLEGLAYLGREAAACQEELASSSALQERQSAELAAGRTSLAQFQQQAAEQAQAFDAACADYEHRVAYLLGRLHDEGRLDPVDAIGEETFSFLRRRVAELEQAVEKTRQDAQQSGKRRVEQDLELISRCQTLTSENKSLRAQVSEATATVDRTNARAATREAQLAQRVCALEGQLELAATSLSAGAPAPGAPVQEGSLAAPAEDAPTASATLPEAEASVCSAGVAGAAAAMLGALGATSSASDTLAPLFAWQGLDAGWREAGLNDEARRELLDDLATDVRALCERRLQEHHAWRKSQEDRVEGLGRELAALEDLLGEAAEEPAVVCTSLLDRARALEQSYSALARLKESRARELDEIQQHVQALRLRLGSPPDDAPIDKESPGALSTAAMTEARVRLKALEAVERERQSCLGAALTRLSHCWDALGLTVPDELEPQEVQMLQGVEVISDDLLKYCESRELALSALQAELEREVADLRERVDHWRQCFMHFGMAVPDDPQLPYIPAVRILRAATADAEIAASDFLQHEKVALQAFFESTRLPNIQSTLDELNCVPGSYMQQLEVLRHHWDRTVVQRQEYRKIVDMIAAREALEVEMREFDLEASDPQRFRKRNYSGVEENRRRVEYQKRLRTLDSSLHAASAEWEEREGLPFHVNGTPYVGNEILNADHTHMYAWTETQLAQKEALHGAGFQPPERRRGEGGFLTERGRAGVRQSQSQQELSHAEQVQRCQSAPRGLRGMSSGSSSGPGGVRRSMGTSRHKGNSLRLGLGAPAR